jgi:hypothetical protein
LAPMYFAGAAVYMGHVALRDKGIAS